MIRILCADISASDERIYQSLYEGASDGAWKNIPIVSRDINVYYPPKEERVSHFRPGMDFFRISLLNTLLCILAVIYGYPSMLIRKLLGIKGCKKNK